MSESDPITLSFWARVGEQENPIVRIADWYKMKDWTVTGALCCDVATSTRDETAILDLPISERVICAYNAPDRWAIEIELSRFRNGASGKRENRKVRFGRSSVPCPWHEHAVEIEIAANAEMWKNDKETRRGYKRIVDELRSLSEANAPCWVLVTEHGRGPSLPELQLRTKDPSIAFSTVFLSVGEFDEPAVKRMAAGAHLERWPNGWLLSSSRFLGASTDNSAAFAVQSWTELRRWRSRN